MKNNIYIYPVIEAFKAGGECPFCTMYDLLETEVIEFVMGPSYMEDDIRMETNKVGFCRNHLIRMFENQNRLGLSLMLHTHLQTMNAKFPKLTKNLAERSPKLFQKKKGPSEAVSFLQEVASSCYVCNRVEKTFERYVDTFFYIYKKDSEIRDLVKNSKGFCLEHLALLLTEAESKLDGKQYENFIDLLLPIQLEAMKALEEDLDWFIRKFDYTNKNEPWKNAKDALPRALQKIGRLKVED